MFNSVDPKADFPSLEEDILAFWTERDTFKASISQRQGRPEFVFYDGPPFATGLPHFGHFVPGTVKDVIPRYKTMKGLRVERRFGWDCHGLPVENLIEKELGLNSKSDIEKFGVAAFNEACRSSVLRYTKEWRTIMTRAGRWVDFDNDYKTMDSEYMESIWWVMKSLWEKGLLYEGHYILPYCPRCATVLSNHELAQPGVYQDVHDPAVTVRFRIGSERGELPRAKQGCQDYFLAWTTTPWTLPSNLALAVGPELDYVMLDEGQSRYVVAEARVPAYYKEGQVPPIAWRGKGAELAGAAYAPLFPYFEKEAGEKAFRVYLGDYVTTSDGAGIVHIAPGFGEDDYRILKGSGIPTICPIDAECRFTDEVADYRGRFVKDCDKDIIERLKAEGALVKREQVLHSYPHCWRCDHPLIYRAVGSWFVKVDPIKKVMLEANSQINWVPEHIKTGRFGKWLEGARDWAISRSRYWGNPLPIWRCPDCGKLSCVGSRQELKDLSGVWPDDLHKHFVDDITIPCACGGSMRRVPEVLDCWFESGSMPYAQVHYPFQNKEWFEGHFPADFISESLDQTRGWFYSLTVLAAALFEKRAFQNCIVSGMVLAADGKKMSKSLRNYTDPMEVIDQYGADALRLCLMRSAVMKADDLKFSDEGVKEVLKSILIPLWNSYSFFVTYANIDKVDPREPNPSCANPMDRWVLSVAERTVAEIDSALAAYDLGGAVEPLVLFIDLLNNWYIRRSRRRFWRSGSDEDKLDAYSALRRVLLRISMAAAPLLPFVAEMIYRNLRRPDMKESVHLNDYPEYQADFRDLDLERKMSLALKAVGMGRALRYQHNLKVRQPLASVHLVTKDTVERAILMEMEAIIQEELNVKQVIFRENEEELVEYQAKANFRVLGKELGKSMKEAAAKIETLSQSEIASLLEGSVLAIEVDGRGVDLTADKLDIRRVERAQLKVLNEGSLTVALDAQVSEELRREGDVRDLIRGVQNLRKESGLEVTDRIRLAVEGSARLRQAFDDFKDKLAQETLAVDVAWGVGPQAAEVEADEECWRVELHKA